MVSDATLQASRPQGRRLRSAADFGLPFAKGRRSGEHLAATSRPLARSFHRSLRGLLFECNGNATWVFEERFSEECPARAWLWLHWHSARRRIKRSSPLTRKQQPGPWLVDAMSASMGSSGLLVLLEHDYKRLGLSFCGLPEKSRCAARAKLREQSGFKTRPNVLAGLMNEVCVEH